MGGGNTLKKIFVGVENKEPFTGTWCRAFLKLGWCALPLCRHILCK